MTKFRFSALLSLTALCLLLSFGPARAQTAAPTPKAVVETYYAALLDTMKQGVELGYAGRYQKLEPAVKQAFNLPQMTKIAIGLSWNDLSKEDQDAAVKAFSDFSVANYASRFKKFDGENFDVLDEKPLSNGGVMVETKLTPGDSDPVTLNYLLRKDETGTPRIVDVYLDGTISELATRRSEFGAVIRRDGISALIKSLNDKTAAMGQCLPK